MLNAFIYFTISAKFYDTGLLAVSSDKILFVKSCSLCSLLGGIVDTKHTYKGSDGAFKSCCYASEDSSYTYSMT